MGQVMWFHARYLTCRAGDLVVGQATAMSIVTALGAAAVNTVVLTMLPNFQDCGESLGLDEMTLWGSWGGFLSLFY